MRLKCICLYILLQNPQRHFAHDCTEYAKFPCDWISFLETVGKIIFIEFRVRSNYLYRGVHMKPLCYMNVCNYNEKHKQFTCVWRGLYHYTDVIMSTMASQITSLTIIYTTVYLSVDQRKYQSSASLAFVRGIHRWPVNSPHNRPLTRKMSPFDTSSLFYISTCIYMIWSILYNSFTVSSLPNPLGDIHSMPCLDAT